MMLTNLINNDLIGSYIVDTTMAIKFSQNMTVMTRQQLFAGYSPLAYIPASMKEKAARQSCYLHSAEALRRWISENAWPHKQFGTVKKLMRGIAR